MNVILLSLIYRWEGWGLERSKGPMLGNGHKHMNQDLSVPKSLPAFSVSQGSLRQQRHLLKLVSKASLAMQATLRACQTNYTIPFLFWIQPREEQSKPATWRRLSRQEPGARATVGRELKTGSPRRVAHLCPQPAPWQALRVSLLRRGKKGMNL